MKEIKVGERVTITLEAVEEGGSYCLGCIFDNDIKSCEEWRNHYPCRSKERSDGKNIVFKKVKE